MKTLLGLYFIFFTIAVVVFNPFYPYTSEYGVSAIIWMPAFILASIMLLFAMFRPFPVNNNDKKRFVYFKTLLSLNSLSIFISLIVNGGSKEIIGFTFVLFVLLFTPSLGYLIGSMRDQKSV